MLLAHDHLQKGWMTPLISSKLYWSPACHPGGTIFIVEPVPPKGTSLQKRVEPILRVGMWLKGEIERDKM